MLLSPTNLPTRVEEIAHRDLSGRIELEDDALEGARHNGGYADIFVGYLTEENNTRIKVAIKVLRMVNEGEVIVKVRRSLIRETVAWHQLHHKNVLEFLGLAPDLGRYDCPALISPYCDRGTAKDYLTSDTDVDTRLFVIKGVAEGLGYLHENEVVHGDLKPNNVLIHDDGRPLLCDFGRSKILTSGGFTTKAAGVCRYQAPELLISEDGPKKSSDIYALATTAYEFWTDMEPFHDIHQDSSIIISIVMRDARPEYPDRAPIGTEELWKIFEDSWKLEPEDRLDAKMLVERLESLSKYLYSEM